LLLFPLAFWARKKWGSWEVMEGVSCVASWCLAESNHVCCCRGKDVRFWSGGGGVLGWFHFTRFGNWFGTKQRPFGGERQSGDSCAGNFGDIVSASYCFL
jgi:hypothetical protein